MHPRVMEQSEVKRPVDHPIGAACFSRGFTLIEWLVVIAIISILMTVSTFAFRNVREKGAMAQAKNLILTSAAIARNYAIENHIEAMMVINPYNGRFELWHLNPPAHGGPWDPFSGGIAPPFTDGYAFAPVFNRLATLPVGSNGKPMVAIFPVDYDDPTYRPTADNEQNMDNLTWTALCFDENGRLVTRTRRIATRSYRFRDGSIRAAGQRNRLETELPNLALREQLPIQPLVTSADTAITSTRGFVICDWTRAQGIVGEAPSPIELITGLLRETRPGRRLSNLGEVVLLDRFSGQPMTGDKK